MVLTTHSDGDNGKKYLEKYGLTDDSITSLNLFLDGTEIKAEGMLEVARGLTDNWSLTNLELRRNDIGIQGAVPLAQALCVNKYLLSLGVGRNKLCSSGGLHIAGALKTNQTLQIIDLEWNDLRDEFGIAMADAMVNNNSLTEISLERNKIQKDGIAAIGAALSKNKKLKSLNLGWNRAKVVGAISLADGLRNNNQLISLNVAMNYIGQEGAFSIATAMSENTSLQSLNLQNNRLGDAIIMFGEAFKVNHTLRELNIESCSISTEACVLFGNALRCVYENVMSMFLSKKKKKNSANSSLMSLNIARNPIGDEGAAAIAESLKTRTAIRFLDFSETGITHLAMKPITNLLESCPNLQTLLLEDNVIGVEGGRQLADKLQQRPALTSLNISRTKLGATGTRFIADALKKTKILYYRNFQIAGNEAGCDPSTVLCKALSRCTSLESFDLSNNDIGEIALESLCQVLVVNENLPYIYLKGNSIAVELTSNALYRTDAVGILTSILGIPWSQTNNEVDDSKEKSPSTQIHVPSSNFASSNISTGTVEHGPEDLFIPSSKSALRPIRGGQIYADSLCASGTGTETGTTLKLIANSDPSTKLKIGHPAVNQTRVVGGYPALTNYQNSFLENNISDLLLTDDQLRKEFNRLDRNGNGYLEEEEFKPIFKSFNNYGVVPTDSEFKNIVRKHNNRDGNKIYFDEYCIIMLGLARR